MSLIPVDSRDGLLDEAVELLADMGVIEARAIARTPGGKPAFGPGSHWEAAIVECDETFLEREDHGVVGEVRRRVVDPGEFGFEIICPECLTVIEDDASWRRAARDWVTESGSTTLQCRECDERTPVQDWAYEPPMGFGDFVLTFWNWPSINREFIHRVQRLVGAHVSLIEGKGGSISSLIPPGDLRASTPPTPR